MELPENIYVEINTPIKSVRIRAAERILSLKAYDGFSTIIQEFIAKEKDPECEKLLKLALRKHSGTLKGFSQITIEETMNLFDALDEIQQLERIFSLKPAQIKENKADNQVQRLFEQAKSQLVQAFLTKKFFRFLPESMLTFFEKSLYSSSVSLQIACIEFLLRFYPKSLKAHLVRLITINDPVIRSLTIWCISKHFPDISRQFISDFLKNGDRYSRFQALQLCATMDFSFIRDLLFEQVARENDIELIKYTCSLLISNPENETPYRLAKIMLSSENEKGQLLKRTIEESCDKIKKLKLTDDFDKYANELNSFTKCIYNKLRFFKIFEDFEEMTEAEKDAIFKHIEENYDDRDFEKALNEYLLSCNNSALKRALNSLFQEKAKNASAQTKDDEPNINGNSLDEENLFKELTRTRFDNSFKPVEKINLILNDRMASPRLRLAALKAATNCRMDNFASEAKKLLKSRDENFVAAALVYLAQLHWDDFHIQIPKFLSSNSFTIRKALITATIKHAPDYARFLIKHMLESSETKKRLFGLESCISFDFSTMLVDLIAFLEKEKEEELINACLAILAANACIEAFITLKLISFPCQNKQKRVNKTLEEIREQLIVSKMTTEADLEELVEQRKEINVMTTLVSARLEEEQKQLIQIKDLIKWDILQLNVGKPQLLLELLDKFRSTLSISKVALAATILAILAFFGGSNEEPRAKNEVKEEVNIIQSAYLPKLPKIDESINALLLEFDPPTQTWAAKTDTGQIIRILPEKKVWKPNEGVSFKVKKAVYSVTGVPVVWAK